MPWSDAAPGLAAQPFAIVEAPDSQSDAVLALLPELAGVPAWAGTGWLAHLSGQPWAVVGAAALEPRVRPDDGREGAGAFAAQVRVLSAWRRQGLGRVLLARLVGQARGWDVDALQTFSSHAPDEPTAAFLRAQGARPGLSLHHFLGETTVTLAAYERREAALRAHGRIPAYFAVVPLHDVPVERAATLYAWQFGGSPAAAGAMLERRLRDPLARALSSAVWDGQTLAALLIGGADDGVGKVEYWVAEPTLRQGWPALLALLGHLRGLRDLGIRQGRYCCNEKAQATLNVARRTGALLEAVRHVYMLDLFTEAGAAA